MADWLSTECPGRRNTKSSYRIVLSRIEVQYKLFLDGREGGNFTEKKTGGWGVLKEKTADLRAEPT